MSRPSGSKWMSEASSSTACAMIELTSFMTGASSADSRISVTSASSCLALLDGLRHRVVEPAHAPDQRLDVVRRGHDRLHLVPGHQLEVVEGEHVRRVGDRDEQAAALVEADRSRVQPAGRLRADQVERRQVGLEAGQVDVAEPEALRGRARELVAGDRVRPRPAAAPAGCPAPLPCSIASSTRSRADEPQLDDHVGDEARTPRAAAASVRRRRSPGRRDAATSSAVVLATAGPPGTARSAGPPGSSLIARPRPLG